MAHNHKTDGAGKVVGIAAMGAGIGALVTALFTSNSGKRLQGEVKQQANKAATKAQHITERGTAEISVAGEEVRQKVNRATAKPVSTPKVTTVRKRPAPRKPTTTDRS